MTIETAGQASQTQLVTESHEEKLTRLFKIEKEIQGKRASRQKFVDSANALKNEIKRLESDKVDLMNLIDSGQETLIPVAVSNDADPESLDDDLPTDEELAEFADEIECTQEPISEEQPNVLERIEQEFEDLADEVLEELADFSGDENQDLQLVEEVENQSPDSIDDSVTENSVENIPENMPEAETEESQESDLPEVTGADEWALFDTVGTTGYGFMRNKKHPTFGAIYRLPVSLRQGDKRSFLVNDYSLNADAQRWEVFCTLLTDQERAEMENQFPAEDTQNEGAS